MRGVNLAYMGRKESQAREPASGQTVREAVDELADSLSSEKARRALRAAAARSQRISRARAFGGRVYKTVDPDTRRASEGSSA